MIIRRVEPSGSGQVALEYLLLLAVVALATILAFAGFKGNIRTTCLDFFNAAAADIIK